MATAPFSKTPRSCALLSSWRHDGQDRPDKQTTKFTTPPWQAVMRILRRAWAKYQQLLITHPWKTQTIGTGIVIKEIPFLDRFEETSPHSNHCRGLELFWKTNELRICGFAIIKLEMSCKLAGYEDVWRHSWDSLCIVRFPYNQNGKQAKCDPPQDFNAKGESTCTTRFHFKTKEFILTRFTTLAILPH